ncbi:hypothetical protein H9Q72_007872 [Fusarium xylarioides]|uniref:Uncharacterized protein n=1 Tax=Fusarium xylarioides TaxID=221167 RepID=A0A9P7HVI9_9HYPO|nr:hypothetical protein H9Q72_007872 [Fusarium xylarioides]
MLAWTRPFSRRGLYKVMDDLSSASPALTALLNNQEYLSHQVSKLTEMVADLKVGPRSRRSSASSHKSGDSDVTNFIENEAVDSFIADDNLTIFEAFVSETGTPINVRKGKKTLEHGGKFRNAAIEMMRESWNPETLDETIARLVSLDDHDITRLYNGMSIKHREQKAQGKGKKTLVQTRTESFQTAIDGEDITPHRRGGKRKAPKTPTAGRMRCHLFVYEKVDDISRASNANMQQKVLDDIAESNREWRRLTEGGSGN